MTANESNEPVYFNSLYRHGVDEKRRVQIPAKWRPASGTTRYAIILWRKGNQKECCLLVLPPEKTQLLVSRMTELRFGDPQAESLRRVLGSNSDVVDLDKSGRICLPEALAREANIGREAVLVGMWDRFQIWNPDRYEAIQERDQAMADQASQLV